MKRNKANTIRVTLDVPIELYERYEQLHPEGEVEEVMLDMLTKCTVGDGLLEAEKKLNEAKQKKAEEVAKWLENIKKKRKSNL